MKEEHIILLNEELKSLEDFNEVCIYEDNDKKIFISIPFVKEMVLRQNILERYNNIEYWEENIINNPDIPEKIEDSEEIKNG